MKITIVSMMNFFNLRSVAVKLTGFVASLALLAGCSADVDTELGYDILPENQKMEMRHLTFKGGQVISFVKGSTADENGIVGGEYHKRDGRFFETRLYQTDSMLSSNVTYGYLGVERSDTFGVRTAGLATSMIFMNTADKEIGFGYKPIFDTMKIMLSITNYGADTLTPVRYKVYELKRPLFRNVVKPDVMVDDTVAYANCDLLAAQMYDPAKPIFTFTFPDGVTTGPTFKSTVVMQPVDMSTKERDGYDGQTWDFVRRLLLIPEDYATNKEWDGYARDKDSLYSDEKEWVKAFHGIYIEPDMESVAEGKRGSIYGFELGTSGLIFYGRNRNPEDPTMIKDSIGVTYAFYDSSVAEYNVYGNIVADTMNMSVNKITHDYSRGLTNSTVSTLGKLNISAYDKAGNKVPREQRDLVPNADLDVCVVEGMAGATTEVFFTDEFLEELRALATAEDGTVHRTVGINQCRLMVYLKGADYDWETTQDNAVALIESLNSSISRLGSYMNLGKKTVGRLSPIPDYNYAQEVQNSETTLNYDGHLNRSRACYVMDITGYMQVLYNYVALLDDVKEFDETKCSRAIYLGPDATAPYTFNRTLLQGSEGQAPIHIELTYTMIK